MSVLKQLPETEGLAGETQMYEQYDYMADKTSLDLVAIAKAADPVTDKEVNVEHHWVITCPECGDGITAGEFFYN